MERILCLIPLALALCACSVKEDRSTCPCELYVRSDEPIKTEGTVLVSVIQDGSVVKQGMLSRQDFDSGACVLTVPRKPSRVTVFTGITGMSAAGGRFLGIPASHQCDEVYSCLEPVLPEGEEYVCTVVPHKNFARLDLEVIGLPEGGGLRVTGKVQGYDLASLDPCEGPFDCVPEQGSGHWRLRLPRQKDESLMLEVTAGSTPVGVVPLGDLIARSGYSFAEEDLPDMSVTVDLTRKDAFIVIAGWERGESFTETF